MSYFSQILAHFCLTTGPGHLLFYTAGLKTPLPQSVRDKQIKMVSSHCVSCHGSLKTGTFLSPRVSGGSVYEKNGVLFSWHVVNYKPRVVPALLLLCQVGIKHTVGIQYILMG